MEKRKEIYKMPLLYRLEIGCGEEKEKKKEGRRACFIDERAGNQLCKYDCYRTPRPWD